MSVDTDVLYPKNARQGLDGGLNDKYENHLIQDNESPDCLNVIFNQGAVETRLGIGKANSSSVGTYVGDGLYTRHDSSNQSQTMCAWWNGSLYTYGTNTFVTIPSAQSIYTAGVRICSTEYENYIYFNDGTTGYKYNQNFTRHGIPVPSAATAASAGTGALSASGQFRYKISNVNTNLVESDVGSASVTFVITATAAGQITISGIPTAPASHGVNRRRIYRTVNSGSSYFRVTELADNTTTAYTDNIADSALGVAAPTDQGQPPAYSAIIAHQNRLFCNDIANPSFVWFSELGNPYVFKTTNFEEIGDNAGDLVKSFGIHDNGLVVFTDRSAYLIYMASTDPNDWAIVKLRSPYGTRSPFSIFSYNNKIMFAAVQNDNLVGFAAISGNAVDPEATLLTVSAAGSDMKSDRIEPDIFQLPSTYVPNISSIVHKNKAYVAVTYGTGNTTNNRIYVFDFSLSNLNKKQEASWVPWSGINSSQLTIYNGEVYAQSSTATGRVYQLNKANTYSDDGSAIDSYLYTKEFSGIPGDEQFMKDFRYANILYEQSGAWFMNLNYRVDSDTGVGDRVQIDLDPGSSLWGSSLVWGSTTWGGGATNAESRIYLGQLRGKRVQFKFSNQNVVNQKFKVVGLQFSYNRKGRR